MRIITTLGAATFAVLLLPSSSYAQNSATNRSPLLEQVAACRQITSDAERLGCFDRAAGALDAAERQGEVVVVERGQIREARRQLFGFEIPSLPPMFGRDDPAERIDAVETTLLSAGQGLDGKWLFRLADGSEWRQIDSDPVRFQNRTGMEIRVRRAALGSYLLTAGRSRAVRVKRQ
ncbi:hypothetical protein [Brevundimonas sp.]|uniref:hypothetical protein n=1 Tax=Brevundimonas sp. TaxID=1871086 RepID=UPI002ED98A26